MTAAALPLLMAGTLLSTTDAANAATRNNSQNGTTLNASVSAGLTQDKTYAWDVTKTAKPASLDIWKGDAGKARYTFNVTKKRRQLGAVSLSGQVTVTNNGSVATAGLTVKAFLEQKGTGSQWNMVGSVHQLSVLS